MCTTVSYFLPRGSSSFSWQLWLGDCIHFAFICTNVIVSKLSRDNILFSTFYTGPPRPLPLLRHCEDDTRLHFEVESDFPRFLDSVLQRTDQISQTKVDEEIVEQHIVVVDQTVRLLRIPRYTLRQQFEY